MFRTSKYLYTKGGHMTEKEKILEIVSETLKQIENTDSFKDIEEILENCFDNANSIIEEVSREENLKETAKLPWAKYFSIDELRNLTVDEEFQIWLIWEVVTDRDYKKRYNLSDPALTLKEKFKKYKERKRVEAEIIENLKDYSVTEVKEVGIGLEVTLQRSKR